MFIDQFEEAFTLCRDGSARDEFIARVVELAGRDDTVVVLAIRADHLGHCAAQPELADLMSGNDVLVGPMREAELRRAIELPARRVGLAIEAGTRRRDRDRRRRPSRRPAAAVDRTGRDVGAPHATGR